MVIPVPATNVKVSAGSPADIVDCPATAIFLYVSWLVAAAEITTLSFAASVVKVTLEPASKVNVSVGVSAGVQKPLIGASLGITKRDMNCERMKLSKLLYDFNMKVAAVSILCQDARVFQAMMHAGTPCPFNGRIGDDAREEWKKYDKQRPDYEEYVAALRYMEKVDNKIIKQLEAEEAPNDAQIITDGNGNPVILGKE